MKQNTLPVLGSHWLTTTSYYDSFITHLDAHFHTAQSVFKCSSIDKRRKKRAPITHVMSRIFNSEIFVSRQGISIVLDLATQFS